MSRSAPKKARPQGSSAFSDVVRKRQNPLKVPRDLANGQFACGGASDDPEIVEFYVRTLRNLRDLQEPLQVLIRVLANEEDETALAFSILALYTQAFHKAWAATFRAWLNGADPEDLKRALKGPPFTAAFLGDAEARSLATRAMLQRARADGLLTVVPSEGEPQ